MAREPHPSFSRLPGSARPPVVVAAFGLGVAAAVIDSLRDAASLEAGEGFAFRVAEVAFDYMAARELVASAAADDPGATAFATITVGELLRRCAVECLALGDRTAEVAALKSALCAPGLRPLTELDMGALEQAADIVLHQPGAVTRVGGADA